MNQFVKKKGKAPATTTGQRLARYLEESRLNALYERVKRAYDESGLIAHGWDHTYRDILNAIDIGETEGAEMSVVLPATILHDIGFLYDRSPEVHNQVGAEHAEEWLADWTQTEREAIRRCIVTHKGRTSGFGSEPESLEEKVVCDADLLEKTGWLGVLQGVRAFAEFAGGTHPEYRDLTTIAKKLSGVKVAGLYTRTGRRMARRRGGVLRGRVGSRALKELGRYR